MHIRRTTPHSHWKAGSRLHMSELAGKVPAEKPKPPLRVPSHELRLRPKIEAIRRGTAPNYLFLQYDMSLYNVSNLFLIPKYFMTESIIERRKPLSEHARRHGWVGSNILIGNLPTDARIHMIREGYVIPEDTVRGSWKRFSFLLQQSSLSRGWLADVLACVRKLDSETFTLDQVYAFEEELTKLHPSNRHIRPKIRQQLQVLRDNNVITFLGKGTYKFYSHSQK